MESVRISSELIVIIAGGLLSIIFTYSPKLNTWFANKSEDFKKLSMLVLMVLVTVAIFVLGCYAIISVDDFICNQATAVDFLYYLVLAIMANQGVYKISPQPLSVRQAKIAHFDIPKGAQ